MAAKKKATKYNLSRTDIEGKLRDLVGMVEDASVFDTTPNELDGKLNDLLAELESLCDDVHTKAF